MHTVDCGVLMGMAVEAWSGLNLTFVNFFCPIDLSKGTDSRVVRRHKSPVYSGPAWWQWTTLLLDETLLSERETS